jgi:hypothetical protein
MLPQFDNMPVLRNLRFSIGGAITRVIRIMNSVAKNWRRSAISGVLRDEAFLNAIPLIICLQCENVVLDIDALIIDDLLTQYFPMRVVLQYSSAQVFTTKYMACDAATKANKTITNFKFILESCARVVQSGRIMILQRIMN